MYWILSAIAWMISCCPPRLLEGIAYTLAYFSFSILRIRRTLILSNLRRVYPDNPSSFHRQLGFLSVYHFCLTILEFFFYSKKDSSPSVTVDTPETLEKIRQTMGLYMIGVHLSNWEACASYLSKNIHPIKMVVKPVGSPGTNRFVKEARVKNGLFPYERKSAGDAVRNMARSIKAGDIVGFVMDQAYPGGPRLPFFGHLAKSNPSFSQIWKRFPAPVFICYFNRRSFGQFHLVVKDEIVLQSSSDDQADMIENTQRVNKAMEACILECPEQYLWMHDRWKPGGKSI